MVDTQGVTAIIVAAGRGSRSPSGARAGRGPGVHRPRGLDRPALLVVPTRAHAPSCEAWGAALPETEAGAVSKFMCQTWDAYKNVKEK